MLKIFLKKTIRRITKITRVWIILILQDQVLQIKVLVAHHLDQTQTRAQAPVPAQVLVLNHSQTLHQSRAPQQASKIPQYKYLIGNDKFVVKATNN